MVLARDGQPEGLVLVADHQTEGRGRLGRRWIAPAGSSLLASVLLRPPATMAGVVTLAAGVALAEAVDAVSGVRVAVKWPNDLVYPGDGSARDRKLAGVLAETDWPARSNIAAGWQAPGSSERVAVVVGTGVNLSWSARSPAELADAATALNLLAGREVDREDLLAAYLLRLDALYGDLVERGDVAPILQRWKARSATLGRHVRVDLGADDVVGVAVDITGDGRLVVETAAGEQRVLAVGDVVHLRSAP